MCDTPHIGGVLAAPSRVAVTELPQAWGDGDDGALERLLPLVEAELRRRLADTWAASGGATHSRSQRW